MTAAYFEDHPTDPDKVILRKKPHLDKGRDYEEGFIDGMQHQMQSSVDKAVNRMAQPEQPKVRTGDCLLVGVCASEGHKIQAKQEQSEPLEYWNAVEGWVKLDEVRKHFDSVSCGTIYKNGGEGRVPLCLAQPKQEQGEPKQEDYLSKAYRLANELRCHLAIAPAQQEQGEPVAWMTINAYGEEDDIHYENPEGHLLEGWTYKPLYTTPPQRTWVDLTDDEMLMIYGQNHEGKKYNLGRMVQQALKEKNNG
jgi:hypothetical protein